MVRATDDDDPVTRSAPAPAISDLEAIVSVLMVAYGLLELVAPDSGRWADARLIVGFAFVLAATIFAMRIFIRRARGASWAQAWGRPGGDRQDGN